jgi:glucose-6-phosphate 1-dehydrogenase
MGDLAHKKIFPALYHMVRHGHLDVPVIGVARAGRTNEQLKDRVRDSIQEQGNNIDQKALTKLLQLLRYFGDAMLFVREDAVEAAWAIVEPILAHATTLHPYEPSSWGPHEANRLALDVGGWHNPEEHKVYEYGSKTVDSGTGSG